MIFSFPDTEKMEHRYAVFEGDVGRGLQMPDLPIRRRRIEFNCLLSGTVGLRELTEIAKTGSEVH